MSVTNKHTINSVRYSCATVIMSFTTIETYVNHHIHKRNGVLATAYDEMSSSLQGRFENMGLTEKLELALLLCNPKLKFRRDGEPIQSLEILKQLRNYLIHNMPVEEITFNEVRSIEDYETKLAKKLKGKFKFNEDNSSAFLYRCLSPACARWAIDYVDDFLDWFSDAFQITRIPLERHWNIDDLPGQAPST